MDAFLRNARKRERWMDTGNGRPFLSLFELPYPIEHTQAKFETNSILNYRPGHP